MLREAWALARNTVEGFVADEAMTRGAAIACYAMFSLAPLLVVAVAIAGLAFGEERCGAPSPSSCAPWSGARAPKRCRRWSAASVRGAPRAPPVFPRW
jgi:hypothetical protein